MRDRSFLANDTVKENSAKQRYVISDRRITSQQTCRFGIIYFSLAHSTIYNNARKKSFLDVGIARWRDTIKEIHASRAFEVDTPSDIPRSSYIMFDRSGYDHGIFHLAIIRNGRIRRTRYTRNRPRRHGAPRKSKFRACATRSRAEWWLMPASRSSPTSRNHSLTCNAAYKSRPYTCCPLYVVLFADTYQVARNFLCSPGLRATTLSAKLCHARIDKIGDEQGC